MLKHPLCSTSCPWVAQGNGAIRNCISFTPSWSPSAPAPWAPPCGCMWRPALHSGRGLHRDRLVLHGPLLETSFWCLEHLLRCCTDLSVCRTVSFRFFTPLCHLLSRSSFSFFSLFSLRHTSETGAGSDLTWGNAGFCPHRPFLQHPYYWKLAM